MPLHPLRFTPMFTQRRAWCCHQRVWSTWGRKENLHEKHHTYMRGNKAAYTLITVWQAWVVGCMRVCSPRHFVPPAHSLAGPVGPGRLCVSGSPRGDFLSQGIFVIGFLSRGLSFPSLGRALERTLVQPPGRARVRQSCCTPRARGSVLCVKVTLCAGGG